MGLIFNNTQLLFSNGNLAMDTNCCCKNSCKCCLPTTIDPLTSECIYWPASAGGPVLKIDFYVDYGCGNVRVNNLPLDAGNVADAGCGPFGIYCGNDGTNGEWRNFPGNAYALGAIWNKCSPDDTYWDCSISFACNPSPNDPNPGIVVEYGFSVFGNVYSPAVDTWIPIGACTYSLTPVSITKCWGTDNSVDISFGPTTLYVDVFPANTSGNTITVSGRLYS